MNPAFVVTEGTTTDDVAAAGFPDPLYCKRGLVDHARLLMDRIDAERGATWTAAAPGVDMFRTSRRSGNNARLDLQSEPPMVNMIVCHVMKNNMARR